jgi:hypothetical protein
MEMLPALSCIITMCLIVGITLHGVGRYKAINALRKRLAPENPLLILQSVAYQTFPITQRKTNPRWQPCILAIFPDAVRLYPMAYHMDKYISLPNSSLRWFGRPEKYHDGRNELWLHAQQADSWTLTKLRTSRYGMADIVRAIKAIVPPEMLTAYRRKRPYIHYDPVIAYPAQQDIYGAWNLADPLTLYVMPLYLVLLQSNKIHRVLPMEHIQQIAALQRIDNPTADGLLTLAVNDEKLSFAVPNHEQVAAAISEAARRSLEQPVVHKKKSDE